MDIDNIIVLNYKCFKDISINNIKPINIIIGKNNIGKSSLLDIIEYIYDSRKLTPGARVLLTKRMDMDSIKSVFSSSTSGGEINGNHFVFGKQYVNQEITFELLNDGKRIMPSDFEKYNSHLSIEQVGHWTRMSGALQIKSKFTKRILAERNIFPEDNDKDMSIDSNGNGITRIITNFLNRDKYNENLVKVDLLNKLNEIMGEDARFTEIVIQQIDTDQGTKWEIFLREEEKGRIALSNSGSGLKTILMVLVYTILIPSVEKKEIGNYIFLFEELENNLHPSLQRRLLRYLEELTEKNATFFLTTHSNVTLDAYQNSDLVNILHVQKDNEVVVNNITNKIQKNTILNDLGIKASDLLQANGIIWVEGPSDRIYINKWLEWIDEDGLREGKDYQCVFYGGRLLSNLSLEDENELINLMNVNRNAIIIMDSDKGRKGASLNSTKNKIIKEAGRKGVHIWITKGREIENYIPTSVLKRYYKKEKSRKEFNQYDKLEDYLDGITKNEGKKYLRNKTEFARKILENSTWEDFSDSYDLNKMIHDVEHTILSWNYDENSKY